MSRPDDLLAHMHHVQQAERDMRDLGLLWQMIEASAAISCPQEVRSILPTLVQTRERFDALQRRLVQQLAAESVAELGDDLQSKAQCAIDILVRNLFERTADVGFLATDEVLRAFCAGDAAARAGQQVALVERLREYRAKYTVYDDVIVLDPTGMVLARIDAAAAPLERCSEPLITEALAADGYVERYGPSALAGGARALMYAHRIEAGSRVVGVLVLRFRFEDEMQRIFGALADERRQMALVLLDADHRVVASNDEHHVPLGARLRTAAAPRTIGVTSFGGRDYLAVTCPTQGYQSYRGPGWTAHAMVSLLTAFRGSGNTDRDHDASIALDHAELAAIQGQADEINRNLRRVVWNGRLMAGLRDGAGQGSGSSDADRERLKAVLTQVHQAGTRTRERLGLAIEHLHQQSMSRSRQQAAELARLAADIMDRNLYERANDCRWWALSPLLREELARPVSDAGCARVSAMLAHINSLYTVYTRIVAFDRDGLVRGASAEDPAQPWVGRMIDERLRDAAARLSHGQHYWASGFEPSDLADGAPTYVFVAAVRDAAGAACGGVAIVFAAARELDAMLRDVVGSKGAHAAFIDAQGRVIASTDPQAAVGAMLPFEARSGVIRRSDGHQVCACVRADGYREFKTEDRYDNGVTAVVWHRLGSLERRQTSTVGRAFAVGEGERGAATVELALFEVGPATYAVPAAAVLEACSQVALVRTPAASDRSIGLLEVLAGSRKRLVQAICARRLFAVTHPARAGDGVMVVLRSLQVPELPVMALRVDDVATVVEADASRLQPAPEGLRDHAPWVAQLLDAGRGTLVQVLDPVQLVALIGLRSPGATGVNLCSATEEAEQAVARSAAAASGRVRQTAAA